MVFTPLRGGRPMPSGLFAERGQNNGRSKLSLNIIIVKENHSNRYCV